MGDQKKTPKQTGRQCNKQEHTQRKAPGSSALPPQGCGTHSDSAALLPIDTLHFLTFGYPASMSVHAPVAALVIMAGCLFKASMFGIIICTLEFSLF